MNISEVLKDKAQNFPHNIAITDPKIGSLTFRELENLSNSYANGFLSLGIKRGDRILVFIRPSIDFPAVVFALFKLQAIPILIDPGMGKKNLLNSISSIKPFGLIAVPEVHIARKFYPKYFSSIKVQVKTGKNFGKIKGLYHLKKFSPIFNEEKTDPDTTAAILFTSGGTGTPKGVVYTHKIFRTQIEILGKMYNLSPLDIDLSGFPLFSLFTVGLGMRTIVPEMDASRPSKCNPEKIVRDILKYKVTYCSGSPAIWARVANYCLKKNIKIPSIKSLVMFGAPIPIILHEKFKSILTQGDTFTPYGATEALPVSNISGTDIINKFANKMKNGFGTCIGTPLIETKIISISDSIENTLNTLGPDEVGEIIVSGDVVTKSYYDKDDETKLAKIIIEGKLYHRMGDLGYLDKEGNLWFCGRKSHRVLNFFSIPCEAIFNNHQEVNRSALITYLGKPALVVERKDKKIPAGIKRKIFENELISLGSKYNHTKEITKFFYSKTFPVDVRHNIKIDRIKLAEEAARGKL